MSDSVTDHVYLGEMRPGASCQHMYEDDTICARQHMVHALTPKQYPPILPGSLVRKADVAQYAREPMPDAARKGIQVTLIDAPVDPLGTMAVIGGIYEGRVARSKAEVTDEQRRSMLADMQATVLNGPLESILFTFLVEGVDRAITHQMVRNRFAFYAQESLRFAVAEDWAQEIPLPPSLAGLAEDAPAVGVWRRSLNQAEDNYAALLGAGMPAEEARGVLPHAITTRLYWTVSLRTLIMEAGKRTCTQAQFPWRMLFAGVAKALRARGEDSQGGPQSEMMTGYKDARGDKHYTNESVQELLRYNRPEDVVADEVTILGDPEVFQGDGWQYEALAGLLRPVCYQTGSCGFMAKFDRGCTIRSRVDANEKLGRPSAEWGTQYDVVDPLEVVVGVGPQSVVVDRDGRTPVFIGAIHSREWAADPGAARVVE